MPKSAHNKRPFLPRARPSSLFRTGTCMQFALTVEQSPTFAMLFPMQASQEALAAGLNARAGSETYKTKGIRVIVVIVVIEHFIEGLLKSHICAVTHGLLELAEGRQRTSELSLCR